MLREPGRPPPISIRPSTTHSAGSRRPAIAFRSVDFPHPEGPRMVTKSPLGMSSVTSRTTSKPLRKRMLTPSTVMRTLAEARGLPAPDDRVDQRRHPCLLHVRERALDRGTGGVGIRDRTLRVPAEALREHREVGRRVVQLLTDMRVLHRRAAVARDAELVLEVVVIGAVVGHDQ